MTNIERQMLINQVVIMSALIHIIYKNNCNEQDINDLAKCVKMTGKLIDSCEGKSKMQNP